jgi:serine phosphatase RsbU (regulator of sigma subunit)
VLFFFTDGLNEARSVAEEEYGRKRAVEIVRRHCQSSVERILRELFQSAFEFTSGQNLKEDITAVVVKVVD